MIKTEIRGDDKIPPLSFPKLMNYKGKEERVVLFTSTYEGVVVSTDCAQSWFEIGYGTNSFMLSAFEDFKGDLILTNFKEIPNESI